MRIDEHRRREGQADDPFSTLKGALYTAVILGFLGFLIRWLWPEIKHDFLPWIREPVRVIVAEGWADRLPEIPEGGPCRVETASPPGKLTRRADTDVYETPSRGKIEIGCEGRKLILDVRRVARVSVVGPERMKPGETASFRLQAFDMGGEVLRLGDLGRVAWRVEGPLHADGEGSPASATKVRAETAGDGSVVAEFDKLTGRLKVRVE